MLETRPALAALGAELELIVVDDGSRDWIAQIAADHPEVRLVRHRTRHGYGAALKTGFARAQGCWLGFLDVDGTYPPEYLAILLDAAHEYEADLVIGLHTAGSDRQNAFSRRGDKPTSALPSIPSPINWS